MQNFVDTYINLNLKDYRNIGIDLEITKLVGLIVIGIMIAAVIMNIIKQRSSMIIKALLRYECNTEETAKTLTELHLASRITERVAFSDTGRLKRVVKRVGAPEYSYDEFVKLQKEKKKPLSPDKKTTKLYIPKDKLDEAKRIFDKGAPSVLDSVLICVLLSALYVCFMFIMPSILSFVNSIL